MKKILKMSLTFLAFLPILFPFISNQGVCQEGLHKERILSPFRGRVPQEWGERVTGVKTRLNTNEKVLALTLDACGGPRGNGYDAKLIEYLRSEKIPATLFLSGKWIDGNPEMFRELAKEPLFEIGNHGLNHKPCSANGRSAYGIAGTKGVIEIFDEIEENAIKIQTLTGRKPKYYRPAAAHCDEICVGIASALGYEVVTFRVLGDGGATYSKHHVKSALLSASPSSIVLLHMNHPEGETAEGLIEAIPELKKRGFGFVRLSEYGLK
jgi:peptidoglycan/xylan/chitin deacetylase (PgdA/CDA1 family)